MSNFSIRPIELKDNPSLQNIIETVMPEFGATGDGYAINDPEVKDMFSCYSRPGHCYFVVTDQSSVLGGGGIGPLKGQGQICELQKMYFLKPLRGQGFGQKILDLCLREAKNMSYQKCYLETLDRMPQAQALYRKNGFTLIENSLGQTGHFGCNRFFIKTL